jgi:hypothetical protein
VNKKVQKNFCPAGAGDVVATARSSKSFLLLFFKKEALPSAFKPPPAPSPSTTPHGPGSHPA